MEMTFPYQQMPKSKNRYSMPFKYKKKIGVNQLETEFENDCIKQKRGNGKFIYHHTHPIVSKSKNWPTLSSYVINQIVLPEYE